MGPLGGRGVQASLNGYRHRYSITNTNTLGVAPLWINIHIHRNAIHILTCINNTLLVLEQKHFDLLGTFEYCVP